MANVAFMDSGPDYDFAQALHNRYGTEKPLETTVMNKDNSDWDVLYPVSSFLETYRFELPKTEFIWPEMGVEVQESDNGDGVRKLDIRLDFVSQACRI